MAHAIGNNDEQMKFLVRAGVIVLAIAGIFALVFFGIEAAILTAAAAAVTALIGVL